MSGTGPNGCTEVFGTANICGDIFVAKLNPTGTAIIYDTSVGTGQGNGIGVDASGNAYVAGAGWANPGTSNAFQLNPGGGQCENPSGFGVTINCTGAVVAVLDSTGTPTYITNLGGAQNNLNDEANAIAIDSTGKIYVTGQAFSTNFPTTSGAFQPSFDSNSGLSSATFVAKIDPTLSGAASLVYSTFLGGGGQGVGLNGEDNAGDQGTAIAVDSSGETYIAGQTFSSSLATSGSFQATKPEPISPYVAKFNAAGSGLLWATYLGGTQPNPCFEDMATGIAIDSTGNAYVVGRTTTSDFPTTPGAFQTTVAAGSDAFVTKINSTGSALIYSTRLGGFTQVNRRQNDLSCTAQGAGGIALDSNNDAFVAGHTITGDFPIASLSLLPTASTNEGFVAELNPAGSSLLFSTYLPGDGENAIALDNAGGIYAAGSTSFLASVDKIDLTAAGPAVLINPQTLTFTSASTTPLPVTLENSGNGPLNISSITPSGSVVETDNCIPTVAAGASCTINVTNTGGNGNFSIADNAPDTPQVITVFEAGTTPTAQLSRSLLAFGPENVGSTSSAQTVFLASIGNTPLVVSNISATGDFKEVNNCPTTILVGTTCQISVTFTPTASGTRTGTLEVDDNAPQPSKASLTGGPPKLFIDIVNNDQIATITPGQTATYTFQVFDGSGYVGPATVTCSGAPKGATCKTSPITLEGATAVNETVTVTTTAGSGVAIRDLNRNPHTPFAPEFTRARDIFARYFATPPRWLGAKTFAAALSTRWLVASLFFTFAGSLLFLFAASSRRRRTVLLCGGSLALCAALTACGGTTIIQNNGGGGGGSSSNATPPGTYTLIVTVSAQGSSNDTALTLQVN